MIKHETPTSLTIRIGTTASPTDCIGPASPNMSGQMTLGHGGRAVYRKATRSPRAAST
ncbi:hypothetical protein AH4AK4_2948 [Aeromonas hydrophila 4AK4]|nr:hypothetical protein AH4AK4_2948 [Aeromonas hydrophila 4AK4]